jgi:hypothetical protein
MRELHLGSSEWVFGHARRLSSELLVSSSEEEDKALMGEV